jgi:hypothetical protein
MGVVTVHSKKAGAMAPPVFDDAFAAAEVARPTLAKKRAGSKPAFDLERALDTFPGDTESDDGSCGLHGMKGGHDDKAPDGRVQRRAVAASTIRFARPRAGPPVTSAELLARAGLERYAQVLCDLGFNDAEMLSDRELLDDDTLINIVGMSREDVRTLRAAIAALGSSPTLNRAAMAAAQRRGKVDGLSAAGAAAAPTTQLRPVDASASLGRLGTRPTGRLGAGPTAAASGAPEVVAARATGSLSRSRFTPDVALRSQRSSTEPTPDVGEGEEVSF